MGFTAAARAGRPLRPLSSLLLLGPVALLACLAGHLLTPGPTYTAPSAQGRRGALAAVASAGLVAPLTLGTPQPAHAEQAWQVQLPRSWRTFSQTPQPPPGELRPVVLAVAGNPDIEGELAVLRVPLSSNPKDPNAAATRDLVQYFTTPAGKTPSVKLEKVVDAVAASQKTTPGLVNFTLLGTAKEETKGGGRYVRYEYQSGLCQGMLVQGSNGKQCQRPDSDEPFPTLNRRHTITVTVTPEDTKGATYFLWLLDASGPVEAWDVLSDPITTVSNSFELASEAQLEKDRTQEITKEQLDALRALQKEGGLPQDENPFR